MNICDKDLLLYFNMKDNESNKGSNRKVNMKV